MPNNGKAALLSIIAPLFTISSSGLAQDKALPPSQSRAQLGDIPASDWGPPLIGHLANGVRFAILPRQGHEPGVALLMRNEGGFIAERRPGERGLAHLIEHVAFHSPTVAAPGDFDHLKRIGIPLTLPAPNAGSTSWRETNYYLSTKTTSSRDIDVLLTLFRDVATGMSLRVDAVDASRGEVMREMADKKLGNEIYASYIAAIAPGSPNDRIEAQNSDDVPIASIDTIRALYQRLYRPENMMIVVVGNVKPAETKALIEQRFEDWEGERPISRPTAYPMFDRNRIQPISFSALPQGRRSALVTVMLPTPAPPSSRGRQGEDDLMDLIVARAITFRLAALQPAAPPGKVGMFIENGEQGQRQIMLWDNFAEGRWEPAVAGLRRVTCGLTMSGFTGDEWEAAKRGVAADLNHRMADMSKVANVDLAKELSHAVADGRYLIPPDELLRYAESMSSQMDARSGNTWWRHQWGSGLEHFRVEAPELAKVTDPVASIRRAANEAIASPRCKVH
jgi:zinc protease